MLFFFCCPWPQKKNLSLMWGSILYCQFYIYCCSHLQKTWDAVERIRESHIQSLSRVWLFATPWTAARQAPLSFTISWNLLKVISIESVRLSNHLLFCLLLLLLSSIFPSIRVFSSESALHIKWPKYWNSAAVWVLPWIFRINLL